MRRILTGQGARKANIENIRLTSNAVWLKFSHIDKCSISCRHCLLLIFSLLLATPCFAQQDYQREVFTNALNLNACQKIRQEAVDEEKYDKELKKILNNKQKSKLKEIDQLQKSADKQGDKRLFKQDPGFQTFGVKEECTNPKYCPAPTTPSKTQ